jgi:2-polyprenyl-3-methyl-5-hydroxy-6-metoxy-1,4-benzoquinol methylase
MSGLVHTIDNGLLGLFGVRYFQLTRDLTIRDRATYVRHYVHQAPQARVSMLDVGCGSSASLLWLRQSADKLASYVGIDRDVVGQGRRFENFPIPRTFHSVDLDQPWDHGRFDLVTCLEVIEHLINDQALFAKLCTQVAPEGRLLLTTPSTPFIARMGKSIPGFDNVSPTQDGDHVRMGYTVDELRAMADANDMEILSVDWLSRYDVEELRSSVATHSPIQRTMHNLRYPRRDPADAWIIGGDPAVNATRYWSIGVYMKHRDAP